jgi:hypothetical protein
MAITKLTKSVVDAAPFRDKDYELCDTITPGFLYKVAAGGRKVFMLQCRPNWGERRKPLAGMFMRHVHAEDDPVRTAADKVAALQRDAVSNSAQAAPATPAKEAETGKTRTSLGNYRPYRHRKSPSRTVPPGGKRTPSSSQEEVA